MMREIPIEKNDDIEFTIDALGSEGQGIGRVDGYTVFVPLALPGEKIRAHVIKTTSGYGVAKLTEVMEPSKDRAQQDCPAYPRCGGCSMRHMSYAAQLAAKTKQVRDAFIRLGRFDGSEINVQPCRGMEHPDRYRNKGSFPYGYDENHCIVPGFFSPRSHRIVPIADCPIQSENIMAAVRVVTDWAREYNITPYDEQKRCGLLRHCMVRESSSGVIVMVVTAGKLPHDIELVEMLRASIPHLIGVVHNLNKAETVVLLSKGEIDSKKVRVEFSLEDMDMSGFQKGATYEQIKAYVLEHTGLKVSSLYISQIKRKCGLDVGQNYNLSKKEDAKVPKCPPEKEAAIRDALKYFQMI